MALTLEQQFNSATSIDAKADVLADYITTYRKKARPGSLRVSNCLFDTGLTPEQKAELFQKTRQRVVAKLIFDYPNVDKGNFRAEVERLDDLAHSFNRTYLSTKKWQSAPTLFQSNIFPSLNLLSKQPIRFAETYRTINDQDFEPLKITTIDNNQLISNSTQFFYNPEHELLFSTVTSLSFDAIDPVAYYGVDLSKIPVEALLDETKFEKQLDICTYLIPNGNPQRAINILRYDGTGFEHFNQVFYNARHKAIFGEVAQVPHFHFQNNVENLIYLKKDKNDVADKGYSNAGCNAIDCQHLRNYLRSLDALSDSDLEAENDSYGMPFLEAKKSGQTFNINIVNILDNYLLTANPENLSTQTILFLNKLYKEINTINDTDTGTSASMMGLGFGGDPDLHEQVAKKQEEKVEDDANQNEKVATFGGLITTLNVIEEVHKQQERTTDARTKLELMAIEGVCAKSVVDSISCVNQMENSPNSGKGKEQNSNNGNPSKDPYTMGV